jgi:hypothetical protein
MSVKQYKVTLNLTFNRIYDEADDYLKELEQEEKENQEDSDTESEDGSDDESEDAPEDDNESDTDSVSSEIRVKAEALRRTDEYYAKHSIEKHIKRNDAFAFTEFLNCSGRIVSAEWDKEKFQVHLVVNTLESKEKVIRELQNTSLEDGEYEACGDTGWILMTRGPNGEIFRNPRDLDKYFMYGSTDYRNNPIIVKRIKPTTTD